VDVFVPLRIGRTGASQSQSTGPDHRLGALDAVFDNTEQLYIRQLDPEQVTTFTHRWFGAVSEAERFLARVQGSPFADAIGRPLVLVNLCMVYHAYGELPEPPILIYQRIVQLYFEEWDRQRDITRVSAYGRFGPERKRQFLAALAYELITTKGTTSYNTFDLEQAYRRVHSRFALPIEQRAKVLAEIESHTGLLTEVKPETWEFSHKSIQEFLCADHISRMPSPNESVARLLRLPDESAVATVLSASPGQFLQLLALRLKATVKTTEDEIQRVGQYWIPFLTRLAIEDAGFDVGYATAIGFLVLSSFGAGDDLANKPQLQTFLDLIEQWCRAPAVKESIGELAELYYTGSLGGRTVQLSVREARREGLPRLRRTCNKSI
jgi:hypothetical protein